MKLKCQYYSWDYYGKYFYVCHILCTKIPENMKNVKLIGAHENDKSNNSVTRIYFEKCDFSRIPQNLGEIFPNLTSLSIWCSNLNEIMKEDLKGLENLEVLLIERSSLEFLPGNLLEEMKNLKVVGFRLNKIRYIGKNLLDGLDKLERVDFRFNFNIDLCWDSTQNNQGLTLERVKHEISEKCAPNSKQDTLQAEKFNKIIFDLIMENEKCQKNNAEAEKNFENILAEKQAEIDKLTMLNQQLNARVREVETKNDNFKQIDIEKQTNIQNLEELASANKNEINQLTFALQNSSTKVSKLEIENQKLKQIIEETNEDKQEREKIIKFLIVGKNDLRQHYKSDDEEDTSGQASKWDENN